MHAQQVTNDAGQSTGPYTGGAVDHSEYNVEIEAVELENAVMTLTKVGVIGLRGVQVHLLLCLGNFSSNACMVTASLRKIRIQRENCHGR